MKRSILLLAALAALGGLASAATFTTPLETCSSAGGVNAALSFTATSMVCDQFNSLPSGDTLTAVNIYSSDSFNQGVPGTLPNAFDFTWTLLDADITGTGGTAPNTCITVTGVTSLASCVDTINGSTTDGVSGSAFYQIGNTITTFTETYLGAGTFSVGDIQAAGEVGAALNATGSVGSTAFVTFTYSTPASGTPEPASMILLGSGLLAGGLIGRKKLVRK